MWPAVNSWPRAEQTRIEATIAGLKRLDISYNDMLQVLVHKAWYMCISHVLHISIAVLFSWNLYTLHLFSLISDAATFLPASALKRAWKKRSQQMQKATLHLSISMKSRLELQHWSSSLALYIFAEALKLRVELLLQVSSECAVARAHHLVWLLRGGNACWSVSSVAIPRHAAAIWGNTK